MRDRSDAIQHDGRVRRHLSVSGNLMIARIPGVDSRSRMVNGAGGIARADVVQRDPRRRQARRTARRLSVHRERTPHHRCRVTRSDTTRDRRAAAPRRVGLPRVHRCGRISASGAVLVSLGRRGVLRHQRRREIPRRRLQADARASICVELEERTESGRTNRQVKGVGRVEIFADDAGQWSERIRSKYLGDSVVRQPRTLRRASCCVSSRIGWSRTAAASRSA